MRWLFATILITAPAYADTLVAARTLRAQTILGPTDLVWRDGPSNGITDVAQVLGQETKVTIYAGRPLSLGDIGPPALVERNQIVTLIYANAVLHIETEARALGRAAVGETIRVLNLSSRTSVTGQVQADGSVHVKGTP